MDRGEGSAAGTMPTKKTKKRMGRPPVPKAEQKRHFVAFKLDDGQFVALERKAKSLGLSKSDAIREAIRRFVETER